MNILVPYFLRRTLDESGIHSFVFWCPSAPTPLGESVEAQLKLGRCDVAPIDPVTLRPVIQGKFIPCALGRTIDADQLADRSGSSDPGGLDNGEGGIRTHGAREDTLVFKTRAINHSTTSPGGSIP